ncbi:MAG: tail fiber domain-containing protein, partial [Vibrio gallaecicus]
AGGQPSQGGRFSPVNTGVDAFQGYTDSAYAQAMRQMQPQMDQQQRGIEQSLVSRGLQPGSPAYNSEMDRMTRGQNDMLSTAAYGAQQQGLAAQNQAYTQQFGYDQLSNQRDIAQIGAAAQTGAAGMGARASMYGADQANYRADLANALATNQLNENGRQFDIGNITQTQGMDQNYMLGLLGQYNNMMNTGINQFNTQQNANQQWYQQAGQMANNAPGVSFTPQTNYVGSQLQGNQNHMGAIGADNQMAASMMGGALSMFSDIRLKENIEFVKTVDDVKVYDFDYKDKAYGAGRYRGVMAQQVMKSHPESVSTVNGHYLVDYSKLPVDMEVIA